MNSRPDDTITTTVQTNNRGDVRIPAEVRKALGFDGQEAVLEVEIQVKTVFEEDNN
jgi:bifunctional DNA-binding transcriptional regulator/antitoxin component of YhaV-PrlF toxin-antitoxin module